MWNECHGKGGAFLFRARNAPGYHFAFIRYKAVIPAALYHKDGFWVHGHIPPGCRAYPVNRTAAPTASAHTARPLSA